MTLARLDLRSYSDATPRALHRRSATSEERERTQRQIHGERLVYENPFIRHEHRLGPDLPDGTEVTRVGRWSEARSTAHPRFSVLG